MIPHFRYNLPNVVLESLACGTPVVGFDVGGIPDMVEHQVKKQWIQEAKKKRTFRFDKGAMIELNPFMSCIVGKKG